MYIYIYVCVYSMYMYVYVYYIYISLASEMRLGLDFAPKVCHLLNALLAALAHAAQCGSWPHDALRPCDLGDSRSTTWSGLIPSPVHIKHPLRNHGLVRNFHIIGTI